MNLILQQGSKPESGSSRAVREFCDACDKRNLRFGGDSSVRADVFLRDLRRVRRFCPITDSELLSIFSVLLTGPALCWFEENQDRFVNWADFEEVFKDTYLPADYDHHLRRDLFLRTQATGEKVDHFLSILTSVNRMLSTPMLEPELISLAMHNLHPQFKLPLAGRTFTSMESLASYCRSIENARVQIQQFEQPPSRLLHDSLFGQQGKTSERQPSQPKLGSSHPAAQSSPTPAVCFKCQKSGHIARNCPTSVSAAVVEVSPEESLAEGNELRE